MLRVSICDDEIQELQKICAFIKDYRLKHPMLDICVKQYHNPYNLLEMIHTQGHFDLYILDILMPQINGIELGEAIRRKDPYAIIIYLTASPDYALDSYRVKAHNYLLKPVSQQQLSAVMDDVSKLLDTESAKRLSIHTTSGMAVIPFYQLTYIEIYNHRLYCHLTNGETLVSITLRQRLELVAAPLAKDKRFVKTSASHIVNMQHITAVSSQGFSLTDGSKVPITRANLKARQVYIEYLLERGMGL